MKKLSVLSLIIFLITGFCVNISNSANASTNEVMLSQELFTIPAGETFRAVVTASINTENVEEGQPVTLVLPTDWYYRNKLIAPTGSSVHGSVIEVSRARHGSLNAKLALRFTSIITPEGQNIPISASVKTDDNSGIIIGGMKFETTPQYSKIINISDTRVVTPLTVNKGSSIPQSVGSGGGLVKSIWDKGSEVDIPANSAIELILTQPITVKPTGV